MKRALLRLAFGTLASLLAILWLAVPAHADVNDFVINYFDAEYSLTRDDPQGVLEVEEVIGVTYSDQNHGLLRALPTMYKRHQLQLDIQGVSSSTGAPAQYTSYQSNGNTVLRIGDPDKTVTGVQEYTIAYTVRNVISFYEGHDELFWDINGDQWAQPAERVTVLLRLPDGVALSSEYEEPLCYTGPYGGTGQDCSLSVDESVLKFETSRTLSPYETMSVVVGFDKGAFAPSEWYETLGEYMGSILKFLAPVLLIGGTAWLYWFRQGRDPKGKGTIIPEYGPPEGVTPIEAGTIADFRTDNRDITATIIDLAIRGYLTIIETIEKRKLRKDLKKYSLKLNKDNFDELTPPERRILKGLFEGKLAGSEVDLSTLKYKLMDVSTELRQTIKERLVSHGFLRKRPFSVTVKFWLALVASYLVSLILVVVTGGGAAVFGVAVGTVLTVIFLLLLPARTAKGVAAKEHILGLKRYIEVAEAERIKKLQSPDAPYAAKSQEPKKTVELFEKLLPYAMVLGVEKQWAAKFEDIYRTPPDWYHGHWTAFHAAVLVSSLDSGVQSSVNTAFSAPSSSSGSGFSGGGSGGGGGGGGGGGW